MKQERRKGGKGILLDKRKLAGWMKAKGYSQERLAEVLGITRTSLNLKLNARRGRTLTLREAQRIREVLGIVDAAEAEGIFFASEVADTQHKEILKH